LNCTLHDTEYFIDNNFTNSSAAAKECKKARTQIKHERCHITKIRAENVYHKTMLQNKNKSISSMFKIL
jgi:hypothetical protein